MRQEVVDVHGRRDSMICLPLAGFFPTCCHHWNEQMQYSCVLAFIYMLVINVVFAGLLLSWQGILQGTDISKADLQYTLSVYMALALIGMGVCFMKRNSSSFVRLCPKLDRAFKKYMMLGVYVFGSGSLVFAIESIFGLAYCPEKATDLVFYTVRFVFTPVQIMFLQRFSSRSFSRGTLLIMLLYHIIGTNISIWMFYIAEETGILGSHEPNAAHIACLHKSNVTKMVQRWDGYTTPFTLEFSLIATGVLVTIRSQMRIFEGQTRNERDAYSSLGERSVSPQDLRNSELPSLPISEGSSHPTTEEQIAMTRKYKGSYPGLMVGLASSMVTIVSAFALQQCNDEKSESFGLIFHHSFITIIFLCHLVALWYTIVGLSLLQWRWNELKSEDYLLIGSGCGVLCLDFLVLLAAVVKTISTPLSNIVDGLLSFQSAVEFLTTLIQIIIIIRARRYNNQITSGYEQTELVLYNEQLIARLSQASIFLVVSNFGFWAMESFLEMKSNNLYPLLQRVYGKRWNHLKSLLYPFKIFFRFHSSTMLLDIWLKFYKKVKQQYAFRSEHEVQDRFPVSPHPEVERHDSQDLG